MDIAGIQSGLIGMALFDSWQAAVTKTHGAHKAKGDPLVAAAGEAFEAYIQAAEIGMAAQIAGVAMYALNPDGASVSPITNAQIAPFLALNLMA